MTRDEICDLVRECGLDWHRGFMPLFEDDDTNRFEVLVQAATAVERERCLNCYSPDDTVSDYQDKIRKGQSE